MKVGTITPSTETLRPHFHKPRDDGIGKIRRSVASGTVAVIGSQRKLFPGPDKEAPSVCIIDTADVQPAHLVLKSGALQSQPFGGASIARDLTSGSFQSIDDHVALCLQERRG